MSEHQQMQQSKKPDSTFQKPATLTSQNPVSHPASIIQRARINPKSLTPADILQLQCTIGNRAVGRLLSEIRNPSKVQQIPIQRQTVPEEEKEPLQGMFERKTEDETCPSCLQRREISEDEEPIQGKFETIQQQAIPEEDEKLQMKSVVQRQEKPEEEEPLQGKIVEIIQRREIPEEEPLQPKSKNNTGMPDNLKAGVESLSGIDMSDVRVEFNSDKPSQVGALAYTQGTNIHVAPGQERHLPHEAWHVVQQKQGRVRPTMQLKNVAVNDNEELEKEADEIGESLNSGKHQRNLEHNLSKNINLIETHLANSQTEAIQRKVIILNDPDKGEYGENDRADLQKKVNARMCGECPFKEKEDKLINSHNSYRFNSIFDFGNYTNTENEEEAKSNMKDELLGLKPEDTKLSQGFVPFSYDLSKGCVVQSFAHIMDVEPKVSHKNFLDEKIDYRESANLLKIFVDIAGLKLIYNEGGTWKDVDPKLLLDKKYVIITPGYSPGLNFHAFVVMKSIKSKRNEYQIFDDQKIVKKYSDGIFIRYVFG